MAWQHVKQTASHLRPYMTVDPSLSEVEKNKIAGYQAVVKKWFGHLCYMQCRKVYETGRKTKRNLLWKSKEQSAKEMKLRKVRKRKQEKRLSRLQTLHRVIEEQFDETGDSLKDLFNSKSATLTNMVKLCVALNNFSNENQKFYLPDLVDRLSERLQVLDSKSSIYQSAEPLCRKLKTELQTLLQKTAAFVQKKDVNSEDFVPDLV